MKNRIVPFFIFLLLLPACKTKKDISISGENIIRLPFPTEIKGFDPALAEDLYSHTAISQVYESLYQYSYLERPYKVEPLLAEKMPDISPDGLTYTVKIKKSVYFNDDPCFQKSGNSKPDPRELTAEDFIYSFKRIADIKTRSNGWWIFDGKIEGLNEFRECSKKTKEANMDYSMKVKGLTAPDRYTLRIKLTKPYPQLLYILAMSYTSAVAKEAVEHYDSEFINHPVGTGPYRLKNWVRNSIIAFEKNPGYRKGEKYPSKGEPDDEKNGFLNDAGKKIPFIDTVEFHIFLEDQPMWLNFLKGKIDCSGIPKDNFSSAITPNKELVPKLKKKGIRLWKVPMLDVTYTAFNMENALLGRNKKLRQAMSLAHHPDLLIELFYNGRAIPAQSPIPPGLDGYDAGYKNPYQGPGILKAKKLLDEAGYPNGKGLPPLEYEVSGTGTTERQFAELFKNEMAELGIKINVNYNTWPEFLSKINQKRAQIYGLAWAGDYPDAENFLQLFYSKNAAPGPNNTNYKNPEFDLLYEKISVMQPSSERTKIYQKMAKMVVEDTPWIMGVHRMAYALNHSWLKNYKPHDIGHNFIKYYRIDTQERSRLLKEKF
ncbi:MAG: ABC transporter substrate-binding protein [Elusimicrobiota bacterium]